MATTPKPVHRVALVGPAGVGKTTHAKLLQKALGGDVLSFATPLKRILRDLFGERMDEPAFAREAAQRFGTDFARKMDPNLWVELLEKKLPQTRSVYVDDARFYNEYVALKRNGFTVVRLHAEPAELRRRRPTMTEAQLAHESEQEQATFREDIFLSTDLKLVSRESVVGGDVFWERETEAESIARVQAVLINKLTMAPAAAPAEA